VAVINFALDVKEENRRNFFEIATTNFLYYLCELEKSNM
jgi:hypothetical protein